MVKKEDGNGQAAAWPPGEPPPISGIRNGCSNGGQAGVASCGEAPPRCRRPRLAAIALEKALNIVIAV
jgi:hypothetical protein